MKKLSLDSGYPSGGHYALLQFYPLDNRLGRPKRRSGLVGGEQKNHGAWNQNSVRLARSLVTELNLICEFLHNVAKRIFFAVHYTPLLYLMK
jgi:hypothetical protein